MMEMSGIWRADGTDEKICSVTTGLVKENWDEEHPGMVKAEYFLGTQGQNVTGWVPVAVPYAFKDCGMYLLPEIGSEVLVAFNMGDRNCPIVIGCLWNQINVLPGETATEKNTIKRFRTKGGCEVVFGEEEEKESIEMHTPAGLKIRIEDENQTISLEDSEQKNGILLEAKEGSVKLFSDKKLVLEVGGQAMITLDGSSHSVTVKADEVKENISKSYQLDAQDLKLGGAQANVEGKSQLSLKSSGIAELKGATVKIN